MHLDAPWYVLVDLYAQCYQSCILRCSRAAYTCACSQQPSADWLQAVLGNGLVPIAENTPPLKIGLSTDVPHVP